MEKEKKVLILCALYNAENYIRGQLDSVVNQTYPNWNVLLSNDNANEATMKIVREFLDKDSRFCLIDNNTGRRGSHGNYRNAVIHSDGEKYDYFAYMDDDDVWKPDKLEVCVAKAEEIKREKGENTPICFTSNMEIIDSEGNLKDPDFASTYQYQIQNPMDAFFTHRVFGCNLFFDRIVYLAVKKLMQDPEFSTMSSFDNFTYQVAAGLDADLSFIPKPLMSYRRHTSNSTKGAVYKINAGYFVRMLKQVDQVIRNNAYIARDSIDAIDRILTLDLKPEKRKELLEIQEGLQKGGITAMKMWHKYHVNCGDQIRTAENWMSLCLGMERKYLNG